MKLEQTPWNITEVFCTSGNQKKRKPLFQEIRKKETLVFYSYSINIRMPPTWSRSGNHRSVLCFLFVDTLHLSRGSTEQRAAAAYALLLVIFSRGCLDQVLFSPRFSWFLGFDSKTVQRSALCRSRRELSNEHLLARFGFDTAENQPCKPSNF